MKVPLSGPHLDAAIAEEVFGYMVEGGKVVTETLRLPQPLGQVERLPHRQEIPPYSTDLNFGWQVAKRVRDEVEAGRLSAEVWHKFERAILDAGIWKMSNTAVSELICRAALEAMPARKEKRG